MQGVGVKTSSPSALLDALFNLFFCLRSSNFVDFQSLCSHRSLHQLFVAVQFQFYFVCVRVFSVKFETSTWRK